MGRRLWAGSVGEMELGGVGRVPVEVACPLSWRPKAMAMLDMGLRATVAMLSRAGKGSRLEDGRREGLGGQQLEF